MRRIEIALLLSLALVAACPAMSTAQGQPDTASTPSQEVNSAQPEPVSDQPDTASTSSQETSSAQPEPVSQAYRLQREDIMRISVLGEPELQVEQMVDPQGYIGVPLLVGSLHVEGLTQGELITKIEEGLATYLVEPKVQITLIRVRNPKVYVLGQVTRPGLHEFRLGDRVMEAIAQAGSFMETADLKGSKLTHKDSKEAIPLDLYKLFYEGDMSQNLVLEDGDTIYLPEDTRNKYFVLGEVLRPTVYRLKTDVTLIDAISMAGGPTQRASLKNTYVVRGDPKNPERIKVDMAKLLKSGDLSENIEIRPGDVVYVPETSKPDWSKVANIISVVVNSSYLARMWGM